MWYIHCTLITHSHIPLFTPITFVNTSVTCVLSVLGLHDWGMVESLEGFTVGHEELFQGLVIVTAIQRTLVIVILGIVQLSVSNSFS